MTRKTWRTWTQNEIRRLEELRLQGRTAAEIARAMGRTEPSVKCQLQANGIAKPSGLARWLPILCKPHTLRSAAQEAGTTKWAVKQAKRKLRRAGFDIPAAVRRGSAAA